ncbi:hypothetical protein K438DRAFT_1105046 [Mycena galopus ATCC 62051]|nr:hypothetical protein K438DRAFT_1105046 [Mycena galopus ATCC 62051]
MVSAAAAASPTHRAPVFPPSFLLSLFIQAKPCFYCIVVLVTLFFSSCYWQPFPADSPLSVPWSENITTFAEALNATLVVPYEKPLPPVMTTLDRCWCDFWGGGFFDPYNVSHWERASVLKIAGELEREHNAELAALAALQAIVGVKEANVSATATEVEPMPRTAAPDPTASARSSPLRGVAASIWSVVHPYIQSARAMAESPLFKKLDNVTASEPEERLPALRWEYDLRTYGLGVVVDFGWTRSS